MAAKKCRNFLKDFAPVLASRELYLIFSPGSTVKNKIKSLAPSQPSESKRPDFLSCEVFWFFSIFYGNICCLHRFALRFCVSLWGGGGESVIVYFVTSYLIFYTLSDPVPKALLKYFINH